MIGLAALSPDRVAGESWRDAGRAGGNKACSVFVLMLPQDMDELLPIGDEDMVDRLAWGLQHHAATIHVLLRHSTSLAACRHVARLQLVGLQRSGVLNFRRPSRNHGHFRPSNDEA